MTPTSYSIQSLVRILDVQARVKELRDEDKLVESFAD
jgi:hypothetical protein